MKTIVIELNGHYQKFSYIMSNVGKDDTQAAQRHLHQKEHYKKKIFILLPTHNIISNVSYPIRIQNLSIIKPRAFSISISNIASLSLGSLA